MRLDTHGGPVAVGALDGSATVHSAGGALRVHCGERLGNVELHSGGGDVAITVSPALRCRLVVQGARAVQLGQTLAVSRVGGAPADGQQGSGVWDVGPAAATSPMGDQAPAATLEVVASGGVVEVGVREAWFSDKLSALKRGGGQ